MPTLQGSGEGDSYDGFHSERWALFALQGGREDICLNVKIVLNSRAGIPIVNAANLSDVEIEEHALPILKTPIIVRRKEINIDGLQRNFMDGNDITKIGNWRTAII